jgi:alpha-beta hydrolase superfamily lysophospholipase
MALSLTPEMIMRVMLGRNQHGQRIREKGMAKLEKRRKDPKDIMYPTALYTASKQEENERFKAEHPEEKISVISYDGLRLAGFVRRQEDSHRWLIAFHGYRADHTEITRLQFAREFFRMGYNILAPDQRVCGESEGSLIGMGWLERYDVMTWVQYIIGKDRNAEIVLFGDSMGASTVLAACGLHQPPQVKAVIADSGYASVEAMAAKTARNMLHMPAKPAIALCDPASRRLAGFRLSEADIAGELARAKVPVLLFHGKEDSIVPYENFEVLSSVRTQSILEAVSFEKCDHVCGSLVEPERYWQTVSSFLEQAFSMYA